MIRHVEEITRIAHVLSDDPDVGDRDLAEALCEAQREILAHRRARKPAPFEMYRIRAVLSAAVRLRGGRRA